METIIKRLDKNHVVQYRALRLKCLQLFPDLNGSTFEEESRQTQLIYEKYISEQTTGKPMFGAFIGEELVGITGFNQEERLKTRHKGEVVQMFVNPEFKGQKIGEHLLNYLIQWCFNQPYIEQLKLTVLLHNARAIHLYEKMGFERYLIDSQYFKSEDTYYDQLFMKLTKTRYLALKTS
jgi:RimJ/RimL family protein N-acetyltransferase